MHHGLLSHAPDAQKGLHRRSVGALVSGRAVGIHSGQLLLKGVGGTEVGQTTLAHRACAAGRAEIKDDVIANLEPGDLFANFGDDTGTLMT